MRVRPTTQPLLLDVITSLGISSYGKSSDIGHGATADQNSASAGREAEQLLQPFDNLLLDKHRCLIESRQMCVHPRCHHVSKHGKWNARTLHPAPVARMEIAIRVGQHVVQKFFVNLIRPLPLVRNRFREGFPYARRNRLPSRLCSKSGEMLKHIVEHSMSKSPELSPVFRIQRQFLL